MRHQPCWGVRKIRAVTLTLTSLSHRTLSFELSVSFEDSSTFGFVTHTLTVLEDNVDTVFLDVWDGWPRGLGRRV
jgi:hypothetical protein